MSLDVRVLEPDQLRAAHTLFAASIHRGPASDEHWNQVVASYEPGRAYGAFTDDVLAGTAVSFATSTAVPGGAAVPTAAVTRVGVRADRTRRGVLTALMRRQLAEVAAAGEPLASLRASEGRIYGRFGYGVASRAQRLRVRRRGGAGWRPGAPDGGSVRMLDRDEILKELIPLHRRLALRRPGGIVRPDHWWETGPWRRIGERAHLVAAVHTGPDGDDGFLFAGVSEHDGFEAVLTVEDLHAADTVAAAGLWRFALDVDLVSAVEGRGRPVDEPVELLLADPRDCQAGAVEDETWLRIVDVPGALAARGFAPAGPVLLAVHDPLLGANSGVYRIADGSAERVGEVGGPVAPELECDVAGLAMAYLGDRAPSTLVATGWWRAPAPEAVARADMAFHTALAPWSGTYF